MSMYDEKTCSSTEAAWLVVNGNKEVMLFEAHLTDCSESPNGFGWYFASYAKQPDGNWEERDGGLYWNYKNATDLESVIGDNLRYDAFIAERIEYSVFEDVCFEGNQEAKQKLLSAASILTERMFEGKTYRVKITETLEREVDVRATSRESAIKRARDDWKRKVHVLDNEDFKGVTFRAVRTSRSRDSR